MKKVPVGAWAEYNTTAGTATMKTRWAFVAREKQSTVLETVVDQSPTASPSRRVVTRFVIAADPLAPGGVLKRMLMQMGEQRPVEMPVDSMNAPGQQFQKPDPKKVVGQERINVAAGWFTATHYRDSSAEGVTDVWISEDAPPLGMVKVLPPARSRPTRSDPGHPGAGIRSRWPRSRDPSRTAPPTTGAARICEVGGLNRAERRAGRGITHVNRTFAPSGPWQAGRRPASPSAQIGSRYRKSHDLPC